MGIVIWDSMAPPSPKSNSTTILWRSYGDLNVPNAVSIPRWVEDHDKALRKRYLSWIYDLGNTRINKNGRRLIDELEIRSGLSFWWMTLLAEKCNFAKSPQINDAIKLMAFDDWASTQSFGTLFFISANREIAECLRIWCARNNVTFDFKFESQSIIQKSVLHSIFLRFPFALQALAWLVRHVVNRWQLRGVGVSEWQRSSAQVTFVSYLLNLVPSSLKENKFESRYWAQLPDLLSRSNCKTNWLHIYISHDLIPDATKAGKVLTGFNRAAEGEQVHVALDSFISWGVIVRSITDWVKIALLTTRSNEGLKNVKSEELVLWPLFARDWRDSLIGKTAMSNAMHLNLLEAAFKSLPLQRVGVYLQENMDWEFALLWAWKAEKHRTIVGFPHTSVRYWDLRYYFDERSFNHDSENSLPLPDKVAVNGLAAMRSFLDSGYPREKLFAAEALRYSYLGKIPNKVPRANTSRTRSLLVLGEFIKSDTEKQIKLLETAIGFLDEVIEVIVKPHPASPIEEKSYPLLKMNITNEPIDQLLSECDIAYSGAMTSAAVDVHCFGVPLISMLDPTQLNLHPLRGEPGVWFVSTPEELAQAIEEIANMKKSPRNINEYFFLDDDLPRWREIVLR